MPQISNAEDAYKHLVEDSPESWIYGLLAFAIIEERRIEWIQHVKEYDGRTPNLTEIENWYRNQPDGALLRAKAEAEDALTLYSDDVLQDVLDLERKEVADGLIVSEIRHNRRLLPQFGINVAGGLVSAILFAVLLSLFAIFVVFDTSPAEVGKNLMNSHITEKSDGKENSN